MTTSEKKKTFQSVRILRNSQAKIKSAAACIISREVKTQEIDQYLSVCVIK